jgi:hypothetical protein
MEKLGTSDAKRPANRSAVRLPLRLPRIDGQATVEMLRGDYRGHTEVPFTRSFVEPMTGIEPAYSAWEADVLPLNYIGLFDWHC